MKSKLVCNLNGNVLDIVSSSKKLGGFYRFDYDIPENVKIINVMSDIEYLGDVFYNLKNIKKVNLPKSIKVIGDNAFMDCDNLKNINFPVKLKEIGYKAFYDCVKLNSIIFNDKLKYIGPSAFFHCSSLKNIDFPKNLRYIGSSAFNSCDNITEVVLNKKLEYLGPAAFFDANKLEKVIINSRKVNISDSCFKKSGVKIVELNDNIKKINKSAFSLCCNLISINLPLRLNELGNFAFYKCLLLNEIRIPGGVKRIGANAFNDCVSLKKVIIEDGVNTIGSYAFYGCSSLEEIELPDSIKKIETAAFENCSKLKRIKLSKNLKIIDHRAFADCVSLEEIIIPDSVTAIIDGAFEGCTSLKRAVISNNVTVLDRFLFKECSSLEEVVIPSCVFSIKENVFNGCSNLKKIVLPKDLKKIEYGAFFGSGLESIDISEGVEEISPSTFDSCKSLKKVKLPSNLKKIDSYAFSHCDFDEINIPSNVTSIGDYTFSDCKKLKRININDNVESLGDGVFDQCSSLEYLPLPKNISVITKEMFQRCDSLVEITIPSEVVFIEDYAFFGCENLKKINFNDKLNKIGDNAFKKCANIEKLVFNDSLVSVGSFAFADCVKIEEVEFGKKVETIDECAFTRCANLMKIVFNDGLNHIGYSSFSECNKLTEVNIPDSVERIDGLAFKDCSSLNKVNIESSDISFCNSAFNRCFNAEITFEGERSYKYNEIAFIDDIDESIYFYDLKKEKFVFYKDRNYYEFKVEDLLNKANDNVKKINMRYYPRLYFWVKKNKFSPHLRVIETFPIKDIDMFYLNNNYRKWAELVNYASYKDHESLCTLLKLSYVLGVFQKSGSKRDEAVDFIKKNIIDVMVGDDLHSVFDGFNINKGFDPLWAEFFMKYYDQLPFPMYTNEKADFIVSSYNNFDIVRKCYPNKVVNTNREADRLTIDDVSEVIDSIEYEFVNKGNEDFANVVGKYGYSQSDFLKLQEWFDKGKKIQENNLKLFISKNKSDDSEVTYELLEKDNPLGAVLGNITNCCQVVNGAGESCVKYGMTMPNSKFMTFNMNKQIIGQAWVWYDEKTGIVCLDNIEVPSNYLDKINHDKKLQKSFLCCLDKIANNFISEMKKHGLEVNKVTVGKGYNDINSVLANKYSLSNGVMLLSDYSGYSDAREQYIIKKNR